MNTSVKDRVDSIPQDEPVVVSIDLLQYADSPRLDGESLEHIHSLVEISLELPPILVHRKTMRVIDGMHRLRAAILSGRREIKVRYFDGVEADAFIAAVAANVKHGLPLSRADREVAVTRILQSHPQWSDRAVADVVGLAATTVARIRSQSTDEDSRPDTRIGRDGRVRPINGAAGRRLAVKLFADRPDASLRDIADMAGISPATAKDVRERLRQGLDPVPAKLALAEQKNGTPARGDRSQSPVVRRLPPQRQLPDTGLLLRKLQRDPSLRLTDNGRHLLRWLNARSLNTQEWEGIDAGIPAHCVPLIVDLALGFADEWASFAEVLRRKAHGEMA